MALTDGNGGDMVMPVAPMYGGGNGGFGNGFGGDWAWIILLLLLGWGNNGWGGFGGMGMGGFAADGAMLYPWMNQAEITTQGFQNQLLNDNITSIRDGVGNLSTQLCNCCGDIQMALANGFAGVEQGANTRQMANMQTAFGLQNAVNAGFNGVQNSLCNGFNGTQMGLADLKYTVAQENCLDRQAFSDGIRDVIAAQTAGFQSIKDELYRDRLDEKDDEIAQLRQEVLFARGQASQIAQNEQIVNSIYNRLDQCPVGTTPVYGRTPIFTCNNGCGCGCGNSNSFFN